jgi:ABC-type uncharacterized transport system substrate-binding protein
MMAANYDPFASGYVKSLARPDGNVTGVFLRQTELAEKQTELLWQAFPDRTRIGILWDAISADQFSAAERRAKIFGLGKTAPLPVDPLAALGIFPRAGAVFE